MQLATLNHLRLGFESQQALVQAQAQAQAPPSLFAGLESCFRHLCRLDLRSESLNWAH